MRDGHASRTAEHNALFRALESSRPESRRLFKDPLARAFLTWLFAIAIRLAVIPGFRELVPWVIDTRWPVEDIRRAASAGALRDWVEGATYPWLGWTRGDQLASSALRHNAAHMGQAVTIRGLAGFALGI